MGVLQPETPANIALEECARRIWEALDGSMDAYIVDTGKRRPWPAIPWGSLSTNAKLDFIETLAILIPGLAEGMRMAHTVNGSVSS